MMEGLYINTDFWVVPLDFQEKVYLAQKRLKTTDVNDHAFHVFVNIFLALIMAL